MVNFRYMVKGKFDSEAFYERLVVFGQKCQKVTTKLLKTDYNRVYCGQLIRCSSSPGANYIEALEALSKKDFTHRLRICRKETRESIHWLRLIKEANSLPREIDKEIDKLISEGREIIKILSSSIITLEKKS